jgi:hypothetical protein
MPNARIGILLGAVLLCTGASAARADDTTDAGARPRSAAALAPRGDSAVAGAEKALSPGRPEHVAVESPPPGKTRNRSPGLIAGGTILLALGLASVIGGIDAAACSECVYIRGIGAPLIVNGIGLTAGGIAMVVSGSRRIPVPAVAVLLPSPAPWASAPVGLAFSGTF